MSRCLVLPENGRRGSGTSLEYRKSVIVIVEDSLPADGRSPIIKLLADRRCASASPSGTHRLQVRRQIMLLKVDKQKLVVIGNGMAGLRTVGKLRERAPGDDDITGIGS